MKSTRICFNKTTVVIISVSVIVLSFIVLANYINSNKINLQSKASEKNSESLINCGQLGQICCGGSTSCESGLECNSSHECQEIQRSCGFKDKNCCGLSNSTTNYYIGAKGCEPNYDLACVGNGDLRKNYTCRSYEDIKKQYILSIKAISGIFWNIDYSIQYNQYWEYGIDIIPVTFIYCTDNAVDTEKTFKKIISPMTIDNPLRVVKNSAICKGGPPQGLSSILTKTLFIRGLEKDKLLTLFDNYYSLNNVSGNKNLNTLENVQSYIVNHGGTVLFQAKQTCDYHICELKE